MALGISHLSNDSCIKLVWSLRVHVCKHYDQGFNIIYMQHLACVLKCLRITNGQYIGASVYIVAQLHLGSYSNADNHVVYCTCIHTACLFDN